jgi:hypothetical protein
VTWVLENLGFVSGRLKMNVFVVRSAALIDNRLGRQIAVKIGLPRRAYAAAKTKRTSVLQIRRLKGQLSAVLRDQLLNE